MRRFTRLTNVFSKKIQNHAATVAIHAVHYNFARVHKTLRITPAMAVGLSDNVWNLEEIVMMADFHTQRRDRVVRNPISFKMEARVRPRHKPRLPHRGFRRMGTTNADKNEPEN